MKRSFALIAIALFLDPLLAILILPASLSILNYEKIKIKMCGGGESPHRIRIKTEAKAKVVASVRVDRIYSIPCRASYFASDDFQE